jgi:hypothetical protein
MQDFLPGLISFGSTPATHPEPHLPGKCTIAWHKGSAFSHADPGTVSFSRNSFQKNIARKGFSSQKIWDFLTLG